MLVGWYLRESVRGDRSHSQLIDTAEDHFMLEILQHLITGRQLHTSTILHLAEDGLVPTVMCEEHRLVRTQASFKKIMNNMFV